MSLFVYLLLFNALNTQSIIIKLRIHVVGAQKGIGYFPFVKNIISRGYINNSNEDTGTVSKLYLLTYSNATAMHKTFKYLKNIEIRWKHTTNQ